MVVAVAVATSLWVVSFVRPRDWVALSCCCCCGYCCCWWLMVHPKAIRMDSVPTDLVVFVVVMRQPMRKWPFEVSVRSCCYRNLFRSCDSNRKRPNEYPIGDS